jgi:hypothetical protein
MAEVSLHSKTDDAWIVIDGKVRRGATSSAARKETLSGLPLRRVTSLQPRRSTTSRPGSGSTRAAPGSLQASQGATAPPSSQRSGTRASRASSPPASTSPMSWMPPRPPPPRCMQRRARPAGGASWSSAPGSAAPHSPTSSPAQSGAPRAPLPRPPIPRAATAAAAAERRGPAGRFDVTVLERAPLVGGTALASSAILFLGPLVERAGPGGTCVDPADSVVAWSGHWQYDFMRALQAGPAQPRPRGAAAAPAPRRACLCGAPRAIRKAHLH